MFLQLAGHANARNSKSQHGSGVGATGAVVTVGPEPDSSSEEPEPELAAAGSSTGRTPHVVDATTVQTALRSPNKLVATES
jgi:hypothetical protein